MFTKNELELLADMVGTELECLTQRQKSIDPHDPTDQDAWQDNLESERQVLNLQSKVQTLIRKLDQ